MGGDAMYKALKRSGATNTTLLVLLVLASYADEDGLCYPSLREIEKKSRLSRPTVIAAIEKLVGSGEVARLTRGHVDWDRVKHRRRAGGFQPTNYYQLKVVNPVDHLSERSSDSEVVKMVNHQGGQNGLPKVVKSTETTLLTGNLSLELGGAARRQPSRWDGKLRDMVHLTWQEHPMLGGVELVEHLRAWLDADAPAINREVKDDDIGAAIEAALEQRQRSASMRRPHQLRRRA